MARLASAVVAALLAVGCSGASSAVPSASLPIDVQHMPYDARCDGSTDDTAAIRAAIEGGVARGREIVFPAGTCMVRPDLTMTDETGGDLLVAFPMASHLHVRGEKGSTILKIADGVSQDSAPRRFALFFSSGQLTDLSFVGITFDMNGAHNRISPERPRRYNRYNQAAIIFSGTNGAAGHAASGTDVRIEDCSFLNSAGTSSLVLGQSNTIDAVLGKRWTIRNSVFLDNGTDTDDHSSIYGWADDVEVSGCSFASSLPWTSTNQVGPLVAFEVHGARTKFTSNRIDGYFQGLWISDNFTSPVEDVVVLGNEFNVSGVGVGFWSEDARSHGIRRVDVGSNLFALSEEPVSIGLRVGVQCLPRREVTDVTIRGNTVKALGTSVGSAGVLVGTQIGGASPDRITVDGNDALNTTFGVYLSTTGAAGLGTVEITNNGATDLEPAGAFAVPQGVSVSGGAAPIAQLDLDGNWAIDTKDVPTTQYGILLQGNVTHLRVGSNRAINVAVADYAELGFTAATRSPSTP